MTVDEKQHNKKIKKLNLKFAAIFSSPPAWRKYETLHHKRSLLHRHMILLHNILFELLIRPQLY